jgi:hypothetical protein
MILSKLTPILDAEVAKKECLENRKESTNRVKITLFCRHNALFNPQEVLAFLQWSTDFGFFFQVL